MKTNDAGIALIREFAGEVLTPYPDPASPLARVCLGRGLKLTQYRKLAGWQGLSGAPWTAGVGHTGPEVKPDMPVSAEQSRAWLLQDLAVTEAGVTRALHGAGASGNEFSAMVSMAFNCGVQAFARSSIAKAHRRGDRAAAAAAFRRWNKAGGRVLPGLVRRRAAEAALYLRPDRPSPAVQTRTTPDVERPVARSPSFIGAATVAMAGVGQQLVDNLAAIKSARDSVAQTGGFAWITQALGALIVVAALHILVRHWLKHRRGEG